MDLYHSLPLEVYALPEYVRQAQALSDKEGDIEAFIRFMLTGELNEHQAVVDPIRNILPQDVGVTALRDYDSLIGYTDNIIVRSTISVYPVPSPAEVLSHSVHLKRPITRDNVSGSIRALNSPNQLACDRRQLTYQYTAYPTSSLRSGVSGT